MPVVPSVAVLWTCGSFLRKSCALLYILFVNGSKQLSSTAMMASRNLFLQWESGIDFGPPQLINGRLISFHVTIMAVVFPSEYIIPFLSILRERQCCALQIKPWPVICCLRSYFVTCPRMYNFFLPEKNPTCICLLLKLLLCGIFWHLVLLIVYLKYLLSA